MCASGGRAGSTPAVFAKKDVASFILVISAPGLLFSAMDQNRVLGIGPNYPIGGDVAQLLRGEHGKQREDAGPLIGSFSFLLALQV